MIRSEYAANLSLSARTPASSGWANPAPRRHTKQPASLISRLIGLFTS